MTQCPTCGAQVEVTDDPLSVLCAECQAFDPPGYTWLHLT